MGVQFKMDSDWDSANQVERWIVGFIVGLLLFYIQNRNPRYWIIVYGIFFFDFKTFIKNKLKMKLKLLRLRARSLGLDPSGTREEIEARIIENSRNSVPKIPQNNCQPHYSLSDEISDNFMTEEEPNLLPNMMMNMEISEKNEEKSRVSAFERIKNRNEKTGISKKNKKKKYLTMPTIETLREMGVNLENHEE